MRLAGKHHQNARLSSPGKTACGHGRIAKSLNIWFFLTLWVTQISPSASIFVIPDKKILGWHPLFYPAGSGLPIALFA
jgi:hypothetical protein